MNELQHIQSKLLTIEIIVESMLEELIEMKIIDKESIDERLNKKVETLNKIAKKLSELKGETQNVSSNGFMNNIVIGEA
jgi:hypothetical protein